MSFCHFSPCRWDECASLERVSFVGLWIALWVTHKDECRQLDSKAFITMVACHVCVVYT